MPRISGATEAGFTLLEVLTAFAIVAALLSAILTLYSDTERTARRAEAKAATLEAARSAIVRMGADVPLATGEVRWTDGPIAVVVSSTPEGLQGLWSVRSTARWDGVETQLDSMKFQPDAQR